MFVVGVWEVQVGINTEEENKGSMNGVVVLLQWQLLLVLSCFVCVDRTAFVVVRLVRVLP